MIKLAVAITETQVLDSIGRNINNFHHNNNSNYLGLYIYIIKTLTSPFQVCHQQAANNIHYHYHQI